jgi:RND family efflux transporter MFP subunit
MALKNKVWFWLLIVAALGMGGVALSRSFNSIEAKTATASSRELVISVTATSTGTVKSEKEFKITAERQGKVSALNVEEGEAVKSGAMIARLDSVEAELNLKLSEAALGRAEAGLAEVKTAFEPARVEVETNIRKAEANLKELRKRLERFGGLHSKGFISQLELDAVEREYEVADAAYESALAGRKQLEAKAEEIKVREAMVSEARSALSLARLNYDYSFIKAPSSGVITSRPVKIGESFSKGGLIATMVSMEPLYVEAFIDEADVASVKEGQVAVITMDAYPGREFKGEVYMISPVVLGGKQEARTFEVRTRLKDKDAVLKPGMSADVEIITESIESALVIPSQAVMEKEGGQYVFVKKGGRARLRAVKTGRSNWTNTEALSGIKEGDEVIVNPDAPGLKDGARVRK